jgi:putative tryptophan/tyrosine transport system substrate-binding protein
VLEERILDRQRRQGDDGAGGLISYGPARRGLRGQILRGANPRKLDVQQPTRSELAINMKTAKMLGMTIP